MNKLIIIINEYAIYILQFFAILVIITGVVKAMWIFIGDALIKDKAVKAIRESRLELGHSFSLGLGFLIGASILKSTLTPTWDDIGKLSVIIAIRTILNYFLTREIKSISE
ncbi:DUF1622 domain-containing protein [bacterium]|nr:DUF1622 domain-containing protein [Candidatus Omnitrophota bacterium]MBU2527859.1 DUF1622 domain-containing protein [bacterium]MBU3929212.1 DUF1622 domain-containing protein [bacterium]MBU4122257.1 DUF1622 domain-containing protein [bacterium]